MTELNMTELNTVTQLTDIEHIRLRPGMYVGPLTFIEQDRWVLRDTLQYAKCVYRPGLLKIIDEVIDNAVDILLKAGGKKIAVKYSDGVITVTDDGIGFPDITDDYNPIVLAFGNARAGSNFNDADNIGQIGTNGVGAFATNCFSEYFEVTSANTRQRNCTKFEHTTLVSSKTTNSTSHGTTVRFKPNYAKFFENTTLTNDELALIYTRLTLLAYSFSSFKFYFNDEHINTRVTNIFENAAVHIRGENWQLGVYVNVDKYGDLSVVNGVENIDGGTHLFYVYKLIRQALDKLDAMTLNTSLRLVFIGSGFKRAQYSSQTKTKLTNSVHEIAQYLGAENIEKLQKTVARCKPIKDYVSARVQADKNFTANKELNKVKRQEILSTKYISAISSSTSASLLITEGESALGGLMHSLGRENYAYYALRGKPLNTFNIDLTTALKNLEIRELLSIITKEQFERIVIATDQDLDGFHIRGLLLGFFYKYMPEVCDKLYFLQTPVLGAYKGDKLVDWSFNVQDTIKRPGVNVKYFKGLGSFDREDLQTVIRANGVESLFDKVEFDNVDVLQDWLGVDSSVRKIKISAHEFNICSI